MQQHMKQASTHAFSPCSTSGALKHIRSDLQAVSIHLNGSGCTFTTCTVVVAFGVQFFFLVMPIPWKSLYIMRLMSGAPWCHLQRQKRDR